MARHQGNARRFQALPQAQPVKKAVKKAPPIIEIIEGMPMSSRVGVGVAVGFFLIAVLIVLAT